MQYPLSSDEHAAMSRYLSGIRRQIQEVSDLFANRYGKDSSIAEIAVKTLVSATLLEHELMLLDGTAQYRRLEQPEPDEMLDENSSLAATTVF